MTKRGVWTAMLAVGAVQLLGARAAAKNCQTAADCGGAPSICELTTYQTCAGKDPACPAGSPCGDKPITDNQPGCAPYVEGLCRRPDELPCQVDADCGVGFRCAEQIGRACSGWATTGGNGVPPSSHEECHETRSLSCKLIETSCSTDRDCAAGLRCQQSAASTCGNVWVTEDKVTRDAEVPKPQCAPVPMLCAPEGYFGSYAEDPRAGGAPGVDTTGSTVENDAVLPEADDEESSAQASDGCSLAPTASADLTWLALASLLTLKRRRRARA